MTRHDAVGRVTNAATPDLFEIEGDQPGATPVQHALAPGATLFRALARPHAAVLLTDLQCVLEQAPLRHMTTSGGFRMSVAMTNCGLLGWVSDGAGYRYIDKDLDSGRRWPSMPASFRELATRSAALAGFHDFEPDACLVNRYEPGARLTLHQDRNERDFTQPIVSISLGLPAVFIFGGTKRAGNAMQIQLTHGDVVVWGGPSRLRYHGVLALKDGQHPLVGRHRINLTFRRAA